jgi:CRP/FNR family cyclic AMP-dependent transcriptional regulator
MKYGLNNTDSTAATFLDKGRRLSYKKGDIIQRANETPRGVYFLTEGYVKEYSLAKDGSEHFHLVYGPGQLFSIIWAFLGITQIVYREAFTDVVVYRIDAAVLKKELARDPVFAQEIQYLLMHQIFVLKTRVENLAFDNAYDKVAYRLLYLAGTLGVKQKDGWFIPLPFRHQQIADSVSITRETASRILERMVRNQLITHDGKGHFVIRNPSGLARTMDFEEIMQTWPHLKS